MATAFTVIDEAGASSVTRKGTVGTTVATLVHCNAPGMRVVLQNQDSTSTNTLTWALNGTPVSGTDGIILDGANARHEIFLVRGDVLYAIAGGDRAVNVVAVPYF